MKKTDHQKIMEYLAKNPGKWYKVSHFQGGFGFPFIGYEAGTRLCDLVRAGKVISRDSNKKNKIGNYYKEYSIRLSTENKNK